MAGDCPAGPNEPKPPGGGGTSLIWPDVSPGSASVQPPFGGGWGALGGCCGASAGAVHVGEDEARLLGLGDVHAVPNAARTPQLDREGRLVRVRVAGPPPVHVVTAVRARARVDRHPRTRLQGEVAREVVLQVADLDPVGHHPRREKDDSTRATLGVGTRTPSTTATTDRLARGSHSSTRLTTCR